MNSGIRTMVADGKSIPCCFGYERDRRLPGFRTKHPTRAGWVLWAYLQRLARTELCTIARTFSENMVPTPSECTALDNREITIEECTFLWTSQMISIMLDNPIYIGWYITGKTQTIRDRKTGDLIEVQKLPPELWLRKFNPDSVIVPASVWRQVYAMRREAKSLRRTPAAARQRVSTYALTGPCVCGHVSKDGKVCGGRTHRYITDAWGQVTMVCSIHAEHPDKCPGFGNLGMGAVERAVTTAVGRQVLDEDLAALFRSEYERDVVAARKRVELKRGIAQRKIDDAQGRVDDIYARRNTDAFSPETLARQAKLAEDALRNARNEFEDVKDAGNLPVGLERLDSLAKGLAHMARNAPFRASTASGRALIDAFRLLVRKVVIHPVSEDGMVSLTIDTDIEKLVGAQPPENTFFPTRSTIRTSYNHKEILAAQRNVLKARRISAKTALLESRTHAISDAAWRVVEPIVGSFETTFRGGVRGLFDAIFLIVKTNGQFAELPERLGDAKALREEVVRLVRKNIWDDCVAALRLRVPSEIAGADLSRFDTTCYPRSHVGKPRPFASLDAEAVLSLKVQAKTPKQRERFDVVAMSRTKSTKDVAKSFGLSEDTVKRAINAFEVFGAPGICVGKAKRSPKLSENEVLGLRPFLERNENPLAPGEPLRMDGVCHHVRMTFGFPISEHAMGKLLRGVGLGLRDLAEQRALDKARKETTGQNVFEGWDEQMAKVVRIPKRSRRKAA